MSPKNIPGTPPALLPSPILLPPALARWSLGDGGDPNPAAVPPPGSAHPQLPTPLLLAVPDRGPQAPSPGTSPSATAGGTRWRGDPRPQTLPGPRCCSGAGTSGRHPRSRVPPPRCHPCHVPAPCQALSSRGPCEPGVPPRRGAGARGPPERQIPSTSYRRSLDLVSSWCEAVITLISSGIAFPPRANFVSTVTSPRGVHALGPAAESEAEAAKPGAPKPTQKRGPPHPPSATPKPYVHREPFCPLAEVSRGPWVLPKVPRGGHLHQSPPGRRAGARGGSQRPAVGLGACQAWALSSLRVLTVTQYPPDVRAIWEETIKASGNGY